MFSVHIIIIYRYVLEKYYTDWQDVDEDIATIPGQGGYWSHGLFVGVTQRHLFDFPTNVHDIVASKKIIYNLPVLLGGCVMYYITTSLDQSFYGFQWLNIKTILGLYIAYYTYAPLLSKSEM